MSSLPFISHHLFAAAVASEGRTPLERPPDHRSSTRPMDYAKAIPLEVLQRDHPASACATRPVTASVSTGRT